MLDNGTNQYFEAVGSMYGELISENDEFADDGEQDLQEEAKSMLDVWNRDKLLDEVKEMREQFRRDEENNAMVYYDGITKFEDMKKKMTPVSEFVWVRYIESKPEGTQINGSSTVLMDRLAFLECDNNPFETTLIEGKPLKVDLAEGPIVHGLLQAVIHLREGERAIFLIHPNSAFGVMGCPPLIPPDSHILYYIKIHKVWDSSKLLDIREYEKQYNVDIPIENKMIVLDDHREQANKLLNEGLPRDALVRYKAAIQMLDEMIEDGSINQERVAESLKKLLINATVVYNKLKMHKSATKTAKRVLLLDPSNAKAFFHLIKARTELSDYSGATYWLEAANKLCPGQRCFNSLKLELDFKRKDELKKRDDILKNMFREYN